jgi:prepilin-type N-terminal cleavage/methylation domain-containing protein
MTNEQGFSLAEVLIAATIGVIVMLGLYLLYDVNQATFIRGEQQTDLQQNARIGMDRIVRELRLAGGDLGAILPTLCATAIQSATPTSVSFIADIDSDGIPEKVEYTYDAACTPNCAADPPRVRRQQWGSLSGTCATGVWSVTNGARSLAERVSTLSFAYYDETGACIGGACVGPPGPVSGANLDRIRRISVMVTTQDAQTGRVPNAFTLRAEIRPRNLGLSP